MKFKLVEGIRKEDNKYIIDMVSDEADDIIHITTDDIFISKFKDNIYYFGYKFNDQISRKERTAFINWLKSITIKDINPDIESFIIKPLKALYKQLELDTIDLMISPRSNTSELVKIIKYVLGTILPHSTIKSSIELIKNLPVDINFDWNLFNNNYEGIVGDEQYKQIYNYIENELMPKIHSLEYFSIAKNVKPKYRQYIQNYLKFESEDSEQIFRSIKSGNILIIDDINTTGSTLNEILKIINVLNSKCTIYIFTLIGKEA